MVLSAMKRLRYLYGAPPLDNFIFKLCYRWTVLLLVVFSFVITCRLWFGDSFSCASSGDNNYANVKCYDDTVYTLPTKLVIKKNESPLTNPLFEDYRRYQDYYPWVNLLFLVHAFSFYLPHLLWKCYERGYIFKLTAGVQKYLDKEEKRGLELCYLAKYVLVTQGKHKLYVLLYICFEILNYAASLSHTLWLVHFFNVTGVPDFIPHILKTWSDFKNFYFPSEGFCELKKFSGSGDVDRYQALCQLPLNALYMKMFLFLHSWYILLTFLTGSVLLYRILLLIPSVRTFISKISSPLAERSILKSVCHRLSYSDWFFLSRLQKAMTDVDYAQMIDKIAVISQGKDPLVEEDKRFSIFDDTTKDFDNSNDTTPV